MTKEKCIGGQPGICPACKPYQDARKLLIKQATRVANKIVPAAKSTNNATNSEKEEWTRIYLFEMERLWLTQQDALQWGWMD